MSELARTVTVHHICHCDAATEHPTDGEDVEHLFTIDGVEFPWHISDTGPVIVRLINDLYKVTVEIYAEHVEAVGIEIQDG
jgi:hypothetical protein